MKTKELIKELQKLPSDMEVIIYHPWNDDEYCEIVTEVEIIKKEDNTYSTTNDLLKNINLSECVIIR